MEEVGSDTMADYEVFVPYIHELAILISRLYWPLRAILLEKGAPITRLVQKLHGRCISSLAVC
jgi:hypothetical protein